MITPRTISSVLLIWALILMVSVLWKNEYLTKIKTPIIPSNETEGQTNFAFDIPSEEEWLHIQPDAFLSTAKNNFITIPLIADISVFDCPEIACKKIGVYPTGTELMINIRTMRDTDEWIMVPWPSPAKGPHTKYISVVELQAGYGGEPEAPQTVINRESFDLTPTRPITINPQTIIGIVCEFKSSDREEKPRITRGSGVIITESGHILTARSVVDIGYLNEGLEDYYRTGCLVGQMQQTDPLPSIEAIKKINAFVRLPYLAYTAEVAYLPENNGLSDYEEAWLDFALIKINGVNPDARYFGGPREVPESFPATPMLISDMPRVGETTLNFAFPSGTTIGNNADIRTLFLQGLLSHVTNYWAGDNRYEDDLFLIETHLDTEDTAGGRFGSPIFWKGYIIGVHTAKQQNSRQIYNISAKSILENLFDNHYPVPIEVQ